MDREYDLFEKFPDGTSLWRASVLGIEGTRLYLQELAQKSGNRFYAIDMVSGKTVDLGSEGGEPGLLAPRRVGRKSKSAVA